MIERTRVSVLLCGPPLSAFGGGPTHMRNMSASPLQNNYRLNHFESGSRNPAKDEGTRATLIRICTSQFLLAWQIVRPRARPQIVHLNGVLDKKAVWRNLTYLMVCKVLLRQLVPQQSWIKWGHWVAKSERIAANALSIPIFTMMR